MNAALKKELSYPPCLLNGNVWNFPRQLLLASLDETLLQTASGL